MKLLIAILLFISVSVNAGQWQTAVSLAEKNKNREAYSLFEKILKSDQDDISQSEILMNMARVKFQEGKFDESIQLYSKVSKDSDFWLDSIEEKAWGYIRQDKFEKALSAYHTLTTPAFAAQVGPETYLIGGYSALKVCDYKSVFDIFKDFKNKYATIATELDKLSKTGTSPAVVKALVKLKSSSDIAWADFGSDVQKLPRYFNRDAQLVKLAKSSGNTSARVKELAKRDADALSKIVQKLHIIEVEAIQRMNLSQGSGKIARDQIARDGDTIDFPKEDEVWLDEVEHYQVQAKGCQVRQGVKL